ncbi:MAG: hypothetical protein WA159_06225 [Variovorax sp.]
MKRRLWKLFRVFLRCALWIAAFAAFVYLCSYLSDAHTRATKAPDCKWIAVENPDNVPYTARFCYLTKDTVLLRLYDAEELHLLAERTYFNLDRPFIAFVQDELVFDTYPEGSFIALPPSLVERLRAKLP